MDDDRPFVGKTAAFRAVDGCVLYVGGTGPPSDEDWAAYLAFIAPRLSKTRITPRIVWDDSGGPSPLNRKRLIALTTDIPTRVALVSSTRTISVVLNWHHDEPGYHEFHPGQLLEAAAFLGLTGESAVRVVTSLHGLRRMLLGGGPLQNP